jgi:hypothetical protein
MPSPSRSKCVVEPLVRHPTWILAGVAISRNSGHIG